MFLSSSEQPGHVVWRWRAGFHLVDSDDHCFAVDVGSDAASVFYRGQQGFFSFCCHLIRSLTLVHDVRDVFSPRTLRWCHLQYGISGPFWYAAGATIQILLFAMISIQLKIRAPGAKTFLQVSWHTICLPNLSTPHVLIWTKAFPNKLGVCFCVALNDFCCLEHFCLWTAQWHFSRLCFR